MSGATINQVTRLEDRVERLEELVLPAETTADPSDIDQENKRLRDAITLALWWLRRPGRAPIACQQQAQVVLSRALEEEAFDDHEQSHR